MKRTILTIATTVMLAFTFSAFATEKSNPLKDMNTANLVSYYLEATTLGSVDFNKYLFADDFQYSNTVNNTVISKRQYLAFLKSQKGLKFNCETNYQILDQSGQSCIAKAIMKFENFTRIDYITMNQSIDGWKVNKVVTTYP